MEEVRSKPIFEPKDKAFKHSEILAQQRCSNTVALQTYFFYGLI